MPNTISPTRSLLPLAAAGWVVSVLLAVPLAREGDEQKRAQPPHENLALFAHSDACIACHNNLTTSRGEDVSIGSMWRATIMANSARDPYWQASVRRETIDHPIRGAEI